MFAWFEHVSGPPLLIFIGAILTAVGGIWSAHRSTEVNKKLTNQQEQLRATNVDIHNDVKQILDHLVAEGKIPKDAAQEVIGILNATLGPLKAEIKAEVQRAEPEAR